MAEPIELWDFSEIENSKDKCKKLQDLIDEGNYNIIIANKDSDDSPIKVFADYNRKYYTQKYVGVLADSEGNKFNIGSRFDKGKNQFFLRYLFEKAFTDYGVVFNDMRVAGNSENMWDFLMLYRYMEQLKKALRKGVFRKYRRFEYNDSRVKGQIDIARHIRLNPLQNGKIAYNAREYTAENYYNVLFLRALDMMERKYRPAVRKIMSKCSDAKLALENLRTQNKDWNTVQIRTVLKETEHKITNNVYRDYEGLRVLSRIIIRRMCVNTFSGERNKVSGVLVDMTKLWEDFLYETILQGADIQREFKILEGHRIIRPDFYFKDKNLVLDAKYRDCWENTFSKEKWDEDVREDVFQVLAYMFSLKCTKGGVIFPVKKKKAGMPESLSVYADGSKNTYFFRLPVYIPDSKNYTDFEHYKPDLEESIKAVTSQLEAKLKTEEKTN